MNAFVTRLLRPALYAVAGAIIAVVLGRIVVAVTGVSCHCWLGNPVVGLRSGAVGGAFFAFIYNPNLFSRDESPAVSTQQRRE